MTLGRWYEVDWKTDDEQLDAAMRLYTDRYGLRLTLKKALEIADVVDSLFHLSVEIKSVSAVGSFSVDRRRRSKGTTGWQVKPTWRGHAVYAPVLEKYGVTSLRHATMFTGCRCMATALNGSFIYDIIDNDASSDYVVARKRA